MLGNLGFGQASVKLSRRSLRVETISEARVIGIGAARVVQYFANASALERERQLVEVHGYVTGVRELVLDRGVAADTLAAYIPLLAPGFSMTNYGMTTRLWGLVCEAVPDPAAAQSLGPVTLSDGRIGTAFERRGRRDGDWRRVRDWAIPFAKSR